MRRIYSIVSSLIVGLCMVLLQNSGPAQGESAASDQVQNLVNELRQELDRGERDRLVDPWFLRDLRSLLERYDWPWRKEILSDDFSGQGPGPDAPWQVTTGEFLIDWRHGLRSVIKPRPPAQAQETTEEEAVSALIGTLLKKAIKQPESEKEAASAEATYAAMIAPVSISNAFAMEVELTSRPVGGVSEGRFELGPYQGAGANAGYRLALITATQAGTPSIELLRLSQKGTTSTLEFYDQPIQLQDEKVHSVSWTRDPNGLMAIQLDGQEVIRTTDRGFRDPFDGVAVVNSGGDFALRRVTVSGTE